MYKDTVAEIKGVLDSIDVNSIGVADREYLEELSSRLAVEYAELKDKDRGEHSEECSLLLSTLQTILSVDKKLDDYVNLRNDRVREDAKRVVYKDSFLINYIDRYFVEHWIFYAGVLGNMVLFVLLDRLLGGFRMFLGVTGILCMVLALYTILDNSTVVTVLYCKPVRPIMYKVISEGCIRRMIEAKYSIALLPVKDEKYSDTVDKAHELGKYLTAEDRLQLEEFIADIRMYREECRPLLYAELQYILNRLEAFNEFALRRL